MNENEINFKVLHAGILHHISVREKEYISLMALIKDKIYPEGFGECGGVGRCGTCLVKSEGDNNSLLIGKEVNTLAKMGIDDPHLRLACQIQVDENLTNTVIEIVDNY